MERSEPKKSHLLAQSIRATAIELDGPPDVVLPALAEFLRRGQAAQDAVNRLIPTCTCRHSSAAHNDGDPADRFCEHCDCKAFTAAGVR